MILQLTIKNVFIFQRGRKLSVLRQQMIRSLMKDYQVVKGCPERTDFCGWPLWYGANASGKSNLGGHHWLSEEGFGSIAFSIQDEPTVLCPFYWIRKLPNDLPNLLIVLYWTALQYKYHLQLTKKAVLAWGAVYLSLYTGRHSFLNAHYKNGVSEIAFNANRTNNKWCGKRRNSMKSVCPTCRYWRFQSGECGYSGNGKSCERLEKAVVYRQ